MKMSFYDFRFCPSTNPLYYVFKKLILTLTTK